MSITIDIPGGTAELFDKTELTPRRRKQAMILGTMLGATLRQMGTAGRLICEGVVVEDRSDLLKEDGSPLFPGPDLEVTRHQFGLINELNDVSAWALLKSWTLPEPVPADPDAFMDIPGPVYDAIRQEVAKIIADSPDISEVFTADALGDDPDAADPSLPTSASAV